MDLIYAWPIRGVTKTRVAAAVDATAVGIAVDEAVTAAYNAAAFNVVDAFVAVNHIASAAIDADAAICASTIARALVLTAASNATSTDSVPVTIALFLILLLSLSLLNL
jgi:hypothetical protein